MSASDEKLLRFVVKTVQETTQTGDLFCENALTVKEANIDALSNEDLLRCFRSFNSFAHSFPAAGHSKESRTGQVKCCGVDFGTFNKFLVRVRAHAESQQIYENSSELIVILIEELLEEVERALSSTNSHAKMQADRWTWKAA